MAKKSAASKGYRRQTVKKPYLSKKEIIALCAIVAVLIVGAILLFRYDDGALKVQDGAVVTEGDNWLIVNGAAARGRARYFKLGEVGEIDGYAREKATSEAEDPNVPRYSFTPEDGDALKIEITASHSPSAKLVGYTNAAIAAMEGCTADETATGEFGGRTCEYFFATHAFHADEPAESEAAEGEAEAETEAETAEGEATEAEAETTEATEAETEAEAETTEAEPAEAEAEAADEAEAAEPNRFTRRLYAYTDAAHDSCVVIHIEAEADAEAALPADEVLTGALAKAVEAVALEPAK